MVLALSPPNLLLWLAALPGVLPCSTPILETGEGGHGVRSQECHCEAHPPHLPSLHQHQEGGNVATEVQPWTCANKHIRDKEPQRAVDTGSEPLYGSYMAWFSSVGGRKARGQGMLTVVIQGSGETLHVPCVKLSMFPCDLNPKMLHTVLLWAKIKGLRSRGGY